MTIRAMRSVHLFAAALSLVSIVGCSSTTTESPNAKAKPDVMDLNDTPPAPIPPAGARGTVVEPVAADPAPAEPAAGPRKHVVAAKDTLYALAKTYYGDSKQWPKIVAANPGLVPEKMPVGKTIIIP
jgi:5'-nucleotidase